MMNKRYEFRPNLFYKCCDVEAAQDTIVVRKSASGKPIHEIRFQDVKYVRELYYGTGVEMNSKEVVSIRVIKVVPFRGRSILIKSASYGCQNGKRPMVIDHSKQFDAFNDYLKKKIAEANPSAFIVEGSLPLSLCWLSFTILSVAFFLLAPVAMFSGNAPLVESLPIWILTSLTCFVFGTASYSIHSAYRPSRMNLKDYLKSIEEANDGVELSL